MEMNKYVEMVSDICRRRLAENKPLSLNVIHDGLVERSEADADDLVLDALKVVCEPYCADENSVLFGFIHRDDSDAFKFLNPVDKSVLDIWEELAEESVFHPLVRARLADVLRFHERNTEKWCSVAVEEYRRAGSSKEVHEYERVECLSEALAIASSSDLSADVVEGALGSVVEYTEDVLVLHDYGSTCVERGMRLLCDHDRLELDLVESAVEKHSIVDFENVLLDFYEGEERENIVNALIHEHESTAVTRRGYKKIRYLERAKRVALEGGLADKVSELTEEIGKENWDLSIQQITSSIIYSSGDRETARESALWVAGRDGLAAALTRFGSLLPDVLSTEAQQRNHLDAVRKRYSQQGEDLWEEETTDTGFRRLFDQDDRGWEKRELGRENLIAIHLFADPFGKQVVKQLASRYGFNQQNIKNAFLTGGFYDYSIAEKIGVSADRWINEDFVSATSVLVLTIEPMMRQLCGSKGIPTTSTDPGKGRVATFGRLLTNMVEQFPFPEKQLAAPKYLKCVLVDDNCYNLRNRLAHGFHEQPHANDWIVLFHIACLLLFLSDGWQAAS